MKAYVLVTTDPAKTRTVIAKMREVPGIKEANEVMGPYDIVAEVEIDRVSDMSMILRQHIRAIEGVQATVTSVSIQ